MEELWNEEWRRKVLADAYRTLMRGSDFDERTLNAFRMYAIEERPAKEVADQLGLSIGSVYMAKHRCAQRLRELEGELVRAYELVG
jgi:RNA polymerase sigma-70 factor (ECF subfamily)